MRKKPRLENAPDWVTAGDEIDEGRERKLADIDERTMRDGTRLGTRSV